MGNSSHANADGSGGALPPRTEAAIRRIVPAFRKWFRFTAALGGPPLTREDLIMGGAHVLAQRIGPLFRSDGPMRDDESMHPRLWCVCFDLPLRLLAEADGVGRPVPTRDWTDAARETLRVAYIRWREVVLRPALGGGHDPSIRELAIRKLTEYGTLLDEPGNPLAALHGAADLGKRRVPWRALHDHVAGEVGSRDPELIASYFIAMILPDDDRVVVRDGKLELNFPKAVDRVAWEVRKPLRRQRKQVPVERRGDFERGSRADDSADVADALDAVLAAADAERIRRVLDAVCAARAALPVTSAALAAVRKHAASLFLGHVTMVDVAKQEGCDRANATKAWKTEREEVAAEVRRRIRGAA